MCSPEVMARVRAEVSRRRLLCSVGVAGLGLGAFAGALPRTVAAQDAATPVATPAVGQTTLTFAQVVDLSHTHGPDFPMFPGAQQMQMNVIVTIAENGFFKNELILDEHTGTHMDAPAHFIEQGATADQLSVADFIAPLVVIDISARAAGDPDAQLMVGDLTAWESANGSIPSGALVAMNSGWEARVSDPANYLNLDADNTPHFPGFHPDAAALLVDERDVVGIGVDTVSLDYGQSQDFATHVTLLSAGKFGLENLANLSAVPAAGATVVVGGPKHVNASGGPARVLALV
ncbi:MAG: cyclase family protein [Thermomicrobiales bacterium]